MADGEAGDREKGKTRENQRKGMSGLKAKSSLSIDVGTREREREKQEQQANVAKTASKWEDALSFDCSA